LWIRATNANTSSTPSCKYRLSEAGRSHVPRLDPSPRLLLPPQSQKSRVVCSPGQTGSGRGEITRIQQVQIRHPCPLRCAGLQFAAFCFELHRWVGLPDDEGRHHHHHLHLLPHHPQNEGQTISDRGQCSRLHRYRHRGSLGHGLLQPLRQLGRSGTSPFYGSPSKSQGTSC
jgi:hypothetical protein